MMSYKAIAEDWLAAKTEIAKKAFYNLVLGLPYKFKGDAPEWEKLKDRVEPHLKRGHVPPRGLLLVGFADVQMRGLWLDIVAFAPNGESWDVDALYIDGDTSKMDGAAFQQLKQGDARPRLPRRLGRRASSTRSASIRATAPTSSMPGCAATSRSIRSPAATSSWRPRASTAGIGRRLASPRWSTSISTARRSARAPRCGASAPGRSRRLYSDLRQEMPAPPAEPIAPDGYCHFGTWNDEVYFKQVTAEQLEDVKHKGRTTSQKWVRAREPLPRLPQVGAKALAEYLGISRTTPEQWAMLAKAARPAAGADASRSGRAGPQGCRRCSRRA
jgi:hypothetical protein